MKERFHFPCQHFASSLTQVKRRKIGEKNECRRFSFGVFYPLFPSVIFFIVLLSTLQTSSLMYNFTINETKLCKSSVPEYINKCMFVYNIKKNVYINIRN